MDTQTVVFGVAALVVIVVLLVQDWQKNKRIESLAARVAEINANPVLLDKLEALATKVVPVETLHAAWEKLDSVLYTLEQFTPTNVDQLLEEIRALGEKVSDGAPNKGGETGGEEKQIPF